MRAKRKMIFTMVAIVLVACTGIILIGNLSKGFQNMDPTEWQLREVNEDNLYQQLAFTHDDTLTDGSWGIAAELDDDNVISVDGVAEKSDEIDVGTYTLKAGTSYVFNSGIKGSEGSFYVCLVDVESGSIFKSSFGNSVVIPASDLLADKQVMVQIRVANEAELHVKIKPVLCLGNSAEDLVEFYK